VIAICDPSLYFSAFVKCFFTGLIKSSIKRAHTRTVSEAKNKLKTMKPKAFLASVAKPSLKRYK
jgi:hypothetical protein